ncbi:MAG: ATP-dependent Lon protease [Flavobacteriales bacterium]|jgi:ATP-dependent Lon protease
MNDMFDKDLIGFSELMDNETELIPLITSEDEELMDAEETPASLPILPLRNTVLFPGVVIPITVGRDKSIKLIQEAYKAKKMIGVVAQLDQKIEEPTEDDINSIGTLASIVRLLKMPDGSTTAIIQGKKRFELKEVIKTDPYLEARVVEFTEKRPTKKDKNFQALVSTIKDMSLTIIKQSPTIPSEASFAIKNIESPSFLINFISSNLNADVNDKQRMLEVADLHKRAEMVLKHLDKELQLLEIKNDIQSKVKTDIDRQQREYFLHQQMKTIQDELGDNPNEREIGELKKRSEKKKWNEKIAKSFHKELDKLQRMNPAGAEFGVQMNYVELLLDLPWNVFTKDKFDLKKAQRVLDRDHHGLEKVKRRIIEHLAVLKLKGDMKAPILCLYGPPGVGKTSLGKSIAESIGRKYVRMSLGGVRDEAEIRGHRKTYIGAMPGRVIQNIKKSGSSNPVFILDEIDKLGKDSHGDPSSALLEVLDPEQNGAFHDNFVELEYDLSKVMFIATANNLSSIHPALRDRMEIIEVNGYAIEEKIEIAKKHLVPKQLSDNGVKKDQIKINKLTLEKLIESYTNESGVRKLSQRISKLVRHRAMELALEQEYELEIKPDQLDDILGPAHSKDKYQNNNVAGVVTGLAWTSVGGAILFIETSLTPGKGKVTLTGNLGSVMKESALIAHEYLKANAELIGLKAEVFDNWNIHLHVPEGATPKDGPSAGITMITAIASAFTQQKVKSHLAMTGEITLRGKVLPVGGIKEKILAAKRAGIKEIVLCEDNKKDILDIDEKYISGLTFHYVAEIEDVLKVALTSTKVKRPKNIV